MLDVLISMIEGCIRYSGERGSHMVRVGWRKQDDGPVFFISCSGTGELKDLSQAFRLSSEEESADNSASIVLAISKRIIGYRGANVDRVRSGGRLYYFVCAFGGEKA